MTLAVFSYRLARSPAGQRPGCRCRNRLKRKSVAAHSQLNIDAIKGRDLMSYSGNSCRAWSTRQPAETSAAARPRGWPDVHGYWGGQGLVGFSVDGATDMDTGRQQLLCPRPNIDAIGEVKVPTSNFAAEYGRNSPPSASPPNPARRVSMVRAGGRTATKTSTRTSFSTTRPVK